MANIDERKLKKQTVVYANNLAVGFCPKLLISAAAPLLIFFLSFCADLATF